MKSDSIIVNQLKIKINGWRSEYEDEQLYMTRRQWWIDKQNKMNRWGWSDEDKQMKVIGRSDRD